MPDSSLMLDLCRELNITVNDLLSGEMVTTDHYNKELENNLLDMLQKEQTDKRLLSLEIFGGVLVSVILLTLVLLARFAQIADWLRPVLIVAGAIPFVIGIGLAIRIEQTAGYYACGKCGYRYIPVYSSVLWAMHINRTRYMRCPKCHQKSWQKKVLNREEPKRNSQNSY